LKQFNFDTLGSTSSIVTAVNTALLKGIEIALPEDDLIQEFTEQVKSYFDKVKANQQANPNTRKPKRHASTKADEW
jgi:type I restriction enzyme S subunit